MAVTLSPATSVTEAVARFASTADFGDAPDELLARATHAVIDTVGVTIAARQEATFTILADALAPASGSAAGEATVLPTRTRASAADAALQNGVAGHALDFDDVADAMTGHPSVVLVSTLLGLAEAQGSTGREFLEAYAAGLEVACAVAAGLPVAPHYSRGWHATSTVGVLGAAAGAGRLLHLDEMAMGHALGIAASLASGSRQNFGTMTKPLHAGHAARDAVLAAQLAARGFTADEHQLEGPMGYFQLYGVDPDPTAVGEMLRHPDALLTGGLNVKKYPCCYFTHRMADAAVAIHRRGLRASEVRSVAVSMEPDGLQAIIHHQPTTGLQGKFSGEYVVAACLLDGAAGLSTFTDEAVARADAQDLLRRVRIEEAATPPFGDATFDQAYATVEVELTDGATLRERCDIPHGDARAPLGVAELEAKFRDCLTFSGADWDADALLSALYGLRSAPSVLLDASQPFGRHLSS
jgi:2-methylcitrate dehydratase PrpD